MSSKRAVLVTGGAGFIGSFVVDRLVDLGHEVTVFDNLEAQVHPNHKPPDYLNPKACLVQGDIRDRDALRYVIEGQQAVIHLAGAVGVGQSQYEIKRYVDVNTGGTANLLDILVNHSHYVEKVIVAASMSSYGEGCYQCPTHGTVRPRLRTQELIETGQWEPPCPHCGGEIHPIATDENAVQNCNSIYSLTKRDQEDMVLNIGRTYSIPSVALRFFNVYGPRQSLSNPYTGVSAIFMSRIKNNHQPIVYEDGQQTRDFISVHDVVDAIVACMEQSAVDYDVFNVGSGKPLTIEGIARTLAQVFGKEIEPDIQYKFRKGDVRHCFADITRIQKALGWAPRVSFEQGMQELIDWSREQEATDTFDQATQELKNRGII